MGLGGCRRPARRSDSPAGSRLQAASWCHVGSPEQPAQLSRAACEPPPRGRSWSPWAAGCRHGAGLRLGPARGCAQPLAARLIVRSSAGARAAGGTAARSSGARRLRAPEPSLRHATPPGSARPGPLPTPPPLVSPLSRAWAHLVAGSGRWEVARTPPAPWPRFPACWLAQAGSTAGRCLVAR